MLLTPGAHPVDALASVLTGATDEGARELAAQLRADPQRLGEALTRVGESDAVVIVVDQLEELFTLCHDEAERRCFVAALLGSRRDPISPVMVTVAPRADFDGRIAAYPELAATVIAHQTMLGPMTPADLRRAVETTGLVLQPGLTDTILEDLGDEPGALPLLSHALLETWERRRRLLLTVEDDRDAGRVRGAIAQTAEDTVRALSSADGAIARSIFPSLTDVGEGAEPTCRRVSRAELGGGPDRGESVERVLGILAGPRLVTLKRQRRGGARGVDSPLAAAARVDRERPCRAARPSPVDRRRARMGRARTRAGRAVARRAARRRSRVGG